MEHVLEKLLKEANDHVVAEKCRRLRIQVRGHADENLMPALWERARSVLWATRGQDGPKLRVTDARVHPTEYVDGSRTVTLIVTVLDNMD